MVEFSISLYENYFHVGALMLTRGAEFRHSKRKLSKLGNALSYHWGAMAYPASYGIRRKAAILCEKSHLKSTHSHRELP